MMWYYVKTLTTRSLINKTNQTKASDSAQIPSLDYHDQFYFAKQGNGPLDHLLEIEISGFLTLLKI
jgi:hypothetical protein